MSEKVWYKPRGCRKWHAITEKRQFDYFAACGRAFAPWYSQISHPTTPPANQCCKACLKAKGKANE